MYELKINPDTRSLPKKAWDFYYHQFPFYMLTSVERIWLHAFLVSFVSFIVYAVYSVPTYLPFIFGRGYYYLTGTDVEL